MENDKYTEITSQLDARQILRYLNSLGIHNISGEVLKYFITDLKKLIKYDLMHKNEQINDQSTEDILIGPERLHSASTFSSRSRSKCQKPGQLICNRENNYRPRPLSVRNIHSAPNLGEQKINENIPKRACSCARIEKKSDTPRELPKSSTAANSNIIKVPKPPVKKKCDPVSLYHYYTSMWAKYKPNVPGENDWADLRWHIRQKMAGSIPSQTSNKIIEHNKENVKNKNS